MIPSLTVTNSFSEISAIVDAVMLHGAIYSAVFDRKSKSTMTSLRGLAPRLAFSVNPHAYGVRPTSRFPTTSMVWTLVCSALASSALLWNRVP